MVMLSLAQGILKMSYTNGMLPAMIGPAKPPKLQNIFAKAIASGSNLAPNTRTALAP